MARRNFPSGGWVPMDAGSRDKRVTVLAVSTTAGSSRFPVETTSTLCVAWMFKEDGTGDERFKTAQNAASVMTRWEMDYRADMDPDLLNVAALRRLSWEGRQYDITSASVIGSKAGVELMTLARTGA